MKRDYKYVQYLSDRDLVVHTINIDDMEIRGGWYRQLTSIEAFTDRLLDRWYCSYHCKSKKGFRATFQKYNESDHRDLYIDGKPVYVYTRRHVKWNSVWDFYNHIGYNHKDRSVKQLDKYILKLEKKVED